MKSFIKQFTTFLVFLIGSVLSTSIKADSQSSLELLFGSAHNFKTPLTIEQNGEEPIKLTAEYESRAFENPVYYNIRYSTQIASRQWEFQFIHHKLHLKNKTNEVQNFEISHGFNIFTGNLVNEWHGLLLRAGGGFVLTHAESTVRNRARNEGGDFFDTDYRIGGPVGIIGLGKRVNLTEKLFANLEVQAVAAYVEVRVAGGHAKVYHASMHGMFGLGYYF